MAIKNAGKQVPLDWEHCSGGRVPHNAIQGGNNPEGEPYYIGHHSHNGDMLVGKVHTRKGKLYAGYYGRSVTKDQYGVLCQKY